MNMRSGLAVISVIGAIGLIIYGILQPVEGEVRWLLCLWASAPLFGLAAYLATRTGETRSLSRNLTNLGLVFLVGFGLISLQLLRQQFVRASAIAMHVVQDEEGQAISNIRPVLASQRVLRGEIRDMREIVLVQSEPVGNAARRVYPLADRYDPRAFSNIVGFFSTRYGQSGLEATYNAYLSGERGNEWQRLRDSLLSETPRGNHLTLTLNADLQAEAAAALGGRTGSVVVLDPRTGAIRALVSNPGFDPRGLSFNPGAADREAENDRITQYWQEIQMESAGQPLLNRTTQGLYPPGSVFKTITAIGVLEHSGVGQPGTITCPETYLPQPDAPPIVNAVSGLHSLTGDPSDLERVYAFSCNTAFAQYATRLGAERMVETAGRFDIGTPQRMTTTYRGLSDLLANQSLLYRDAGFLNQPRALADTGYGQGQLLVTPLQMALVAAAIANDGIMMQPYLVQTVTRPDGGRILTHTPQRIRRTMSSATAQTMLNNMSAVARYGFGQSISSFVPGIAVGGKSGTAEHVAGASPHAWFIAVAPLDAPRYAVAVMVERGGEGSSVGAELAGRVLTAAFATE
ncbi:penicillin-binding transpeptidase domain-containing protein [Candidatus Chloroploca sp. Khr17]|uniref:penicillin-binding transpeptidase domain-containing protein n=1 Tax=Candidatus Chloroploca sp. Khr17 TaxID=2496869 RepID=UPI001F111622|nr:penicillin-binding protein 2 [Candidatus Chloroploca sp. Khr17]